MYRRVRSSVHNLVPHRSTTRNILVGTVTGVVILPHCLEIDVRLLSMKLCRTCKEQKLPVEFNACKRNADGFDTQCKACRREYDNRHYASSDKRREEIRLNRKRTELEVRRLIGEYLLDKSCVGCGIDDRRVLQFDHRDGVKKSFNVAEHGGRSWKTVLNEIEKCDIRCANCHAIRTSIQFGWYASVG